jgi:NTE family protein
LKSGVLKYYSVIIFILITAHCSYSQESPADIISDTVSLSLKIKPGIDTSVCNIFPKNYSSKKIALVLSGGGARGIAQLGVISILESNNIFPDMIVGTSMGSITGGFYASGYSVDEIKSILRNFNWDRALSLTNKYQRTSLFLEQKKIQDRSLVTIPLDGIKPVLLPSSFSNGQYLSEKINSFILNSRYHVKNNFGDLKIPFTAVATDLNTGKKIILSKGNLSEAIKASFTFPLLYSPININGKDLVDGGLTENIPAGVAKSLGADYIIAVNSTSPLRKDTELQDPLNIADQILSITMVQLNNLQLKNANTLITPDLGNYSATDFTKIDYLISKGREKTSELIDKIKSDIDSLELSDSKYFNNFITNPEVEVNSEYLRENILADLVKSTDKNFEKFTSIEKNLKMIYKTGYFKDVKAVIYRKDDSAKIVYNLTSYPELKQINFTGRYSFIDTLINDFKKDNLYKPVNSVKCKMLYDNILGLLRKNSFSAAEITKFYFQEASGILEVFVNGGFIEGIEITGNKITNENVIAREIKTGTGYPILKKEVDESIRNVMSTNLFKQVSFNYEFKNDSYKPYLSVNVIEKSSKAFRFSMRADNTYNVQLLLDLRDENIFGTGIETGILAAGGLRNRIYQFEIKSNQFFSLPLTFNLNAYYGFKDIYRYLQIIDSVDNRYFVEKTGEYGNYRNGGLSFLFGTQLQRLGTIYGQAFIENQQIKNIFNSESLTEILRVVKLKFGGLFDTQDILPYPSSGALLNFYYETSNDILKGSLSYSKFYFSYDQYFPVKKSQTLRPRFIFGFADKTTPLTEQYSLGGEKSFFGMLEDELRGRQILEASFEYRYLFPYKMFFNTYLSIRYDVGNMWIVTEDIKFKDLRHGLGITASFDTPVGEASFSAGKSFLIKKGLTEDSFIFGPNVFYFSIGYDL